MASPDAITRGLALLHESYPTREVTGATGAAFAVLFRDTPDAVWLEACAFLCREPGRRFFPTTGELSAVLASRVPVPDVHAVIATIQGLGSYSPHGWQYPALETVRRRLGVAAASALGVVGVHRLYSSDDTTRSIAERDFAETYRAEVLADRRTALPAPAEATALPGADAHKLIASVALSLDSER